jgi:hypothetical protein
VLAASAIWLAGCTIQVNTVIQPDGSGIYRTEIGFTAQEQKSLAATSGSVDQLCEESRKSSETNYARPVISEVAERDGSRWCSLTVAFATLDELRAIYSAAGSGVRIDRLEIVDDQVVYDITLTGNTNQQTDSPFSQLGGLIAQALDASWRVTLPGRLGNHNGEQTEGNTIIWKLEAGITEKRLRAESRLGGLPGWLAPALVASGVVLVVVAAIGLVRAGQVQTPVPTEVSPANLPLQASSTPEGPTRAGAVFCPNCGQALTSEAQFCPACGTRRRA